MRDALAFFRQISAEIPDVAIVGHPSRTWYTDTDLLFAVLEILRETRLFRPKHGGKFPFDLQIEEVCRYMGLMDVMVGPTDRKQRLAPYLRPYEMLDGCELLIVFPPEKGRPEEADPRIVRLAYDEGLAVLSVKRSGDMTFRRPT